uniref:NADH-ubiquinone oxidoreductase chain 6 n=1 Tax=Amphimallon solstitiale TaxID=360071 RepID=A0A4Y5QK46_9SCAR|nr:NADH dehydrogenase subunit 6 [Amphimallon solstitiale]
MIMSLSLIVLITSITFIFMKHPLSLGLILLIETVAISLITGFFNLNFWYSYILFLIMIGGMLVLFIYMTSVASNEKFSFSIKITMLLLILTIISVFTLINVEQYFPNINNMNMESLNSSLDFSYSLNKFINKPMDLVMFLLIIYLLITLIAVVKITDIKKGPLRQSN